MPQAARKPSGAPTPGESGGSGADRNYSEMGQQIKEKYGRKPAAKPQASSSPPGMAADAQAPAPVKFRSLPNVLNVYRQFLPENTDRMVQEELKRNNGNLQAAFATVGQMYGDAISAAAAKDKIRVSQINKKDLQYTAADLAKQRQSQSAVTPMVTGGVPLTPEQQVKLKATEDDITAQEAAKAGMDVARAFENLHGRPLPEQYDDPPEQKQPVMEMPEEEIVAEGAPKDGKTMPAEAPDAPAPGFGDVKVSEQADDLGKKLRDGVKAWNSAKQTEEEPE